jgi:hypothetical protein
MRKVLLSATALALCFVMVGACESDLDREDRKLATTYAGGGGGGGNSTGGGRSYDADRALGRKLSKYIRCINTGANRVFRARSRYLSWADKDKGPTCKERRIYYGTYRLYNVNTCTTGLLAANLKKPSLPALHKAAAGFGKSVRALKPVLDTAYEYYNKRQYKGDGCARGKALHPKLMAAWAAASRHNLEMRRLVAKHNSALQGRRLSRVVGQYGKTHPRYFLLKVIAVAKATLQTFRTQLREKKPDLAKLRAAEANYRAVIKQMMAGKATAPGVTGYSSYRSQAQDLAKRFAETLEARSSNKKRTRMERRWLRSSSTAHLVKGSYARVSKSYDRLVGAFNRVRFRR